MLSVLLSELIKEKKHKIRWKRGCYSKVEIEFYNNNARSPGWCTPTRAVKKLPKSRSSTAKVNFNKLF